MAEPAEVSSQGSSPERRLLYSVEEAAELLGIGRTFMFELVATGQVASLKLGKRRKIPRSALDEYVTRLAAEQAASGI